GRRARGRAAACRSPPAPVGPARPTSPRRPPTTPPRPAHTQSAHSRSRRSRRRPPRRSRTADNTRTPRRSPWSPLQRPPCRTCVQPIDPHRQNRPDTPRQSRLLWLRSLSCATSKLDALADPQRTEHWSRRPPALEEAIGYLEIIVCGLL